MDNIDLSNIKNLKFYNVSYREYLALYNDLIIGVYPFAITIQSAYNENGSVVSYENLKYSHRTQLHHQNFVKGVITHDDPCIIFEEVSGRKIHHNEGDDDLMQLDHKLDVQSFESGIKSTIRDDKLKSIGI